MMRNQRLLSAIPPLIILVAVLVVHGSSPVGQTDGDTRWSIHLAESIVRERDFDLDEYRSLMSPGERKVRFVNNHIYSYFPIGASLLAAPLVGLYDLIDPQASEQIEQRYRSLEVAIASVIVALTAVVIYLIARRSLSIKQSLLVAFIFAFCTSAWSTASRALWQHSPSMLALSLVLYLALLARERPWLIQVAGIPLAFSYVSRPTNAVSLVLFTLFVLLRYRRYFLRFLLWSALVAVPFLALNWSTDHSFLAPYYQPQRIGNLARFSEALVGNLVSPSRGLFIFSPILLLSLYGVYLKARDFRANQPCELLDPLLLLAIVLHWVAVSSFPHWWAGYSFGARFLTDMIPYLVYLLIPTIPRVMHLGRGFRPASALCGCLLLISFLVHHRGATDQATGDWNGLPVSVDLEPSRIWDWYDIQFLRNVPVLDPLIPPQVVYGPAKINIVSTSAVTGEARRVITLYDGRYRNLDWTVQPPPGVVASASSGGSATSVSLTITVSTEGYSKGSHDLGELLIFVARTGTNPSRAERVAIPVHLHVIGGESYLPWVVRQ